MAENDVDHFIETIRHDETLTQLQRGQYTGPVTSQMCKDLAARIDATGLNVDLSKLPVACSGKHAEAVSEAIKMRRRNTIQRDAMHAQVRTRRPRYRADGVPGLPVQGMPRSNPLGRYRTKSTPSTQVKDEHIEHHVHA